MRGWARPDYGYFGGKPPFQRHLENQRNETRQWSDKDDPPTADDIAQFKEKTGETLKLAIKNKFLTRQQLSALLKIKNKGKKKEKQLEFYDFLLKLRDEDCVPAMEAVAVGTFATMRLALLAQLQKQGIDVTTSPDTGR